MPFLAIGKTLIDVQQGKLILSIDDEQVTFDVFKDMDFPNEIKSCYQISDIDMVLRHARVNYPHCHLRYILVTLLILIIKIRIYMNF